MEVSLNISPTVSLTQAAPPLPRAVTTKVQAIEPGEEPATLPSNKPFVGQVVSAQLSEAEPVEMRTETTTTERTLRPYDVPMLPSEAQADQATTENQETEVTDPAKAEDA